MDVQEAIDSRRSIRKFQEKAVADEQLIGIMQAGANAPSSKNRQPWEFAVVRGRAKEALVGAMESGIAREKEECAWLPNSRQHLGAAAHTADIIKQVQLLS